MRIAGTATAYPPYYFTQREVVDALKANWEQGREVEAAFERMHGRTGVDGRYFCRPLLEYLELDTWGKCNDVWIETAEKLGEQAIECLLKTTGVTREQVGSLIFVSVTGVSSPSVDARLVNRMKLSPQIKRTPIFGLGCVAGAAGLARAADYVKAYPDKAAVLLSVELCSLTWQRGDISVANLISSGLFGDGCAAVLVTGDQLELSSPASTNGAGGAHGAHSSPGPRILDSFQVFYPDTQDVMGWAVSEKGFRVVLSIDVPRVVRANLGNDVDTFLAKHGMKRADIGTWIMHTGGPKVLEASAKSLGIADSELEVSWQALGRVGNLSSASVLVVLDEIMKHRRPPVGTRSILAAMGPGFCAEMLLLEW